MASALADCRRRSYFRGFFSNFSVTADGSKMVMDEGTFEYGVWATDIPSIVQGRLSNDGRIARASNNILASVSPDGGRLLFRRVVPATGQHTATQWMSVFGEDGTIQRLAGGELFQSLHRTQESLDLYRMSGPGKSQLLGSPPRPLVGVSVSQDLKRAVAFDRDYHADAWMYSVVRY